MNNTTRDLVLVTGGSGLIGSAVMARLAGRFTVIDLDVTPPGRLPEGAEFLEMDISSDESVGGVLGRLLNRHDRIASVIHLAAYYDFSGAPSDRYEEITVLGTRRLLAALQAHQVEQLVFSSTMLVHAPCPPGRRINEDSPLEPKWAYPESKVEAERLLRERRGGIPLVVLRIAGVYDDRCHSPPLANQIQRINERWLTSHVYPGDTSRGQAFLHLDDLVDAIDRVVERRGQLPGELTLLLGEPQTISYAELQRAFGMLIHGEQWRTTQIPKIVAKTGAWVLDNVPLAEEPFIKPWMIDLADDHYELDISRARSLLGWEPTRSLPQKLPKMIAALKADPRRWYQENKLTSHEQLVAAGAPERES